jgi:hypothetical protein
VEGQIAPYAALAMISFGGMFAVLTEWPGQVSGVRTVPQRLGIVPLDLALAARHVAAKLTRSESADVVCCQLLDLGDGCSMLA